MARILVVDDEPGIRKAFKDILTLQNHTIDEACDGIECISKAKQNSFDVIFLDIKMQNMDGFTALTRLVEICPEVPVVMMSGHATVEIAVDLVKNGAFDFITKPLDLNRLIIIIRNAVDKSTLVQETRTLKRKVNQVKVQEIIGESEAIMKVKQSIEKASQSDKARVLILGNNGTGKELVAKWIHEKSARNESNFVEVNCAAIPSELIESTLFGHIKGSFTGAFKDQIGKFEQANGGTLFLDEVGDMGLSAQAKILRALQESKINRIGSDKDIKVDVRVIAATNKDLKEEIRKGNFREDLYNRLEVIDIYVPSLNERRGDIPLLIEHFIENICDEYGASPKIIDLDAIMHLQNMNWTGNIRQLRNVIEKLIIMTSGNLITIDDVKEHVTNRSEVSNSMIEMFMKHDTLDEVLQKVKNDFEKYIHQMSH